MRNKAYSLLPLFFILVIAYLIRVLKPSVFISEIDYPGHIVATMRLFLSSFFEIKKLSANFFIQLVSFRHGFTTMLIPYLLYAVFFSFFKIGITEAHLVVVNSILGILSIISLYFFAHVIYGKKTALITILFYSIIPIHIGLSRVHVGNQIIQSIFYPLSLGLLFLYLKKQRKVYMLFYYLTTFFYIGSDNAFLVGLMMQIVFVLFFHKKYATSLKVVSQTFLNLRYVLFILLPSFAYFVIDMIRIFKYGMVAPGGFIFRSVSKIAHISFTPIKPIIWSIELFGPVFVVCTVVMLTYALRKKIVKREQFFIIWITIYLVLLSASSSIERNYIFYVAVPICILLGHYLQKKIWIVTGTIIITLLYSFSVIFSIPVAFSKIITYGSVDFEMKNNDYGIKTLGYLVRKQLLPVHLIDTGNKVKKMSIHMDFPGAWYYTGDYFFDKPDVDLSEAKNNVTIVYRPHVDTPGNNAIFKYIKKHSLNKIGIIISGKKILLELYSDEKREFKIYDVKSYNILFDKEFGNIQSITKLRLGIY